MWRPRDIIIIIIIIIIIVRDLVKTVTHTEHCKRDSNSAHAHFAVLLINTVNYTYTIATHWWQYVMLCNYIVRVSSGRFPWAHLDAADIHVTLALVLPCMDHCGRSRLFMQSCYEAQPRPLPMHTYMSESLCQLSNQYSPNSVVTGHIGGGLWPDSASLAWENSFGHFYNSKYMQIYTKQ